MFSLLFLNCFFMFYPLTSCRADFVERERERERERALRLRSVATLRELREQFDELTNLMLRDLSIGRAESSHQQGQNHQRRQKQGMKYYSFTDIGMSFGFIPIILVKYDE